MRGPPNTNEIEIEKTSFFSSLSILAVTRKCLLHPQNRWTLLNSSYKKTLYGTQKKRKKIYKWKKSVEDVTPIYMFFCLFVCESQYNSTRMEMKWMGCRTTNKHDFFPWNVIWIFFFVWMKRRRENIFVLLKWWWWSKKK